MTESNTKRGPKSSTDQICLSSIAHRCITFPSSFWRALSISIRGARACFRNIGIRCLAIINFQHVNFKGDDHLLPYRCQVPC